MRHWIAGLALGAWLTSATAPVAASPDSPAGAFDALVADYESWRLAENPILAGRRGDPAAAGRWPDVSFEAVRARAAAQRRFLDRLAGIEVSELDAIDRASHAVLDYLLSSAVELAGFEPERMPFVNDSGFFSMPLSVAQSTRLASVAAAEAWLARLERLPGYLEQQTRWLARGVESGFVQPAYVVKGVVAQVETIAGTPPADSPLLAPLDTLPAALERRHGDALRRRAQALVAERVVPAYQRLLAFFRDVYLAEPRGSIAIAEVPDGRAYYRALVRHHTTLDTTPEAVHRRGREEVKRIRAEMDAVIERTGFDGDFDEFIAFLRSDERFYADSEAELLREAAWIAKRADDGMPRLFARLPRLPYGVRPVPEHLAPTYTTGRYWSGDLDNGVAGGYMVNTYALDQRPLYALPALTLHEAVPGHHHQIALAKELEDIPEFRRDTYITAFGEGWGLYAERLGVEMGIYTTPYEHFGRLTYEMWRACRLVVDTGIHHYGWARERAEACLLDNSALAPHNVRTEVARYIAWPGQALAYKTGEMLIRELRARAEARLGEAFDLRAFHDHLLGAGAMPLAALESRMETWIVAREAGGSSETGL